MADGNKKTRSRPQVQHGVDVKALAMTKDGLGKVNTTTLIAYLRSEGVPCKVKDKKGDLVAKVMAHLKLPVPESPTPMSQQSELITDNNQTCDVSHEIEFY